MKLGNKILFIIVLTAISNYTFSQSPNTAPIVNVSSSFDSSELSVTFNLETKKEVAIYKQPVIAENCDESSVDVVIVIEKLDDPSKKYIIMPCHADIDRVYSLDGTFGPMIKLKNSKSEDYKYVLKKDYVEDGKYRLKIRFYYFIKNQRLSAESKYIYFSFSK